MADDEYERERQENIRKNRELMLSLGLNPAQPSSSRPLSNNSNSRRPKPARVTEDKDSLRTKRTRLRSAAPSSSYPEPVRKSARLSNQSTISYNEDDKTIRAKEENSRLQKDDDLYQLPKLKKLQNPSLPQNFEEIKTEIYENAPSPPKRDSNGNILFENKNRHFMPNVTPKEMLEGGIFGGTAFRPYYSKIAKTELNPKEELKEFPKEWFETISDQDQQLTSSIYQPEFNRFGVKAGQSLEEWENAGWVRAQDPRSWFQWYFRFYQGRRTSDDARQIGRWLKACGPAGRFKRSLVAKIHRANANWDDESVSPVVRQTLFHWAYQLTESDYNAYLP